MACVTITPDVAVQEFATNAAAIAGTIGKSVRVGTPFANVLEDGTFEQGVSDTLQSVVQGRAATNASRTRPVFAPFSTVCDNAAFITKTGGKIYNYSLGLFSGISDAICAQGAYSAYKDSLLAQLKSIQDYVKELYHEDVRANLLDSSGMKYVVTDSANFQTGLTGGENQVAVDFANVRSNAVLTFARLKRIANFMVQTGKIERFGDGEDAHLRFIGSPQILDQIRNDITPDARALAAGQDRLGRDTLKTWMFEYLFRGIKAAEDQIPLRANYNEIDGTYDLVPPYLTEADSYGNTSVTNPAWVAAEFEIGILMGKNSFVRVVPQNWSGEGVTKFNRRAFGGEVQFISNPDMTCNLWGDKGVLAYRLARGYKPVRPWAVCPIIYRNPDACNLDGLVPCVS